MQNRERDSSSYDMDSSVWIQRIHRRTHLYLTELFPLRAHISRESKRGWFCEKKIYIMWDDMLRIVLIYRINYSQERVIYVRI